MDYYELAEDNLDAVRLLINGKKYMQAVYYSCLTVEMYLKSKHSVVFSFSDLDKTHDIVGLYRDLKDKYRSSKNLHKIVATMRKYFNESRYPQGDRSVYTKEFAEQFLQYAEDVKDYVDNECQATLEELQKKYIKDVEPTPSMTEWSRKNK